MDADPPVEVVTLDGERTAYRRCGSGPPIVLLHGLAETSRFFWRAFIAHFQATHTLIAVDLRGHGDSAWPRRGYAPTAQAQRVRLLCDHLRLDSPVLLGHSLGGIIATKFAILYPDRLSRLVVYDSPLGGGFRRNLSLLTHVPPSVSLMVGGLLLPLVGKFAFARRTPRQLRALLEGLRVFCDPKHFTDEMLQEQMRSSYEGVAHSVWHAVMRENLAKDYGRIAVPTLLIRGACDIVVPVRWMEEAARAIPRAQFVTIRDAGHLSLIEQPEPFNRTVAAFLSQSS